MATMQEPDSRDGGYDRRSTLAARAAWATAAVYALVALVAIWALSGCGGGVDSGGTGASTASATLGPVSGFGSIVVAGIHHDETGAQIVDDDGRPLGAEALKLGTMTNIEGSAVVTSGARRESTAARVRVIEQVVGPVDSVDAAAASLVVLGQRVVITPTTVLDAALAGGLAVLRPGEVLAVHGQLDVAAGRIVGTRVEPRPLATAYVLRAPVVSYARSARRIVLGGVEIDLAGLAEAELPASLPPGTLARAKLATQPVGAGSTAPVWRATALRAATPMLGDREQVEIEGRITAFTSPQSFSVDGVPVDASGASFEGGTAGLAVGARVEVEGRAVGGVLVAREVELESDDGSDGRRFEVEGRISALDTTALTFVVRSVTVSYAGTPRFEGGTAADLALERKVAVKGTLSADRTRLQAESIHVER
ncbi:MAG: hypothetical protein KIT17_14960 [Rubrivivax sp.]|nr:hypothetical protein [Rubrivivax sp.]